MRYAIYFTPPADSPLTRLAASWLGRDPFSGEATEPPAVSTLSPAEIGFHTAAPRRYGFHATLKAPFQLAPAETEASLGDALSRFASGVEPFAVQLAIGRIDGFFALVPAGPAPLLNRLADDVVAAFDRFRAPLGEAEIERRNPDALSAEEFRNLHRWGYPYVFDTFRFHMTLTGRVGADEAERVRVALDEVFGATVARPVAIGGLALFVEPERGAPFGVRCYSPVSGHRRIPEERKSA
jgi:putative phosphonate metabolism protein